MREIIFDTETTGLSNKEDRIIEIGAVELDNRFPTGRTFHELINPGDRQVDPGAYEVHGISNDDLKDKPVFADVVDRFVEFVGDGKLVAHNAKFDVGFIDAEFARLGKPPLDPGRVVDSLAIARRKHPMGPNSLDALCKRYGIDNSRRTKHGALLDSELLAEVYIELMGGRQAGLVLDPVVRDKTTDSSDRLEDRKKAVLVRQRPLPSRLTDSDLEAHEQLVNQLGDQPLWRGLKPD